MVASESLQKLRAKSLEEAADPEEIIGEAATGSIE
jgi:hypothetical protein